MTTSNRLSSNADIVSNDAARGEATVAAKVISQSHLVTQSGECMRFTTVNLDD